VARSAARPACIQKRGKFLASSFRDAEFWGRPLDEPEQVCINRPLIGDEATIEKTLFGKLMSREDIKINERFELDAKIKKVAMAKGYDSIVLMTSKAYTDCKKNGKMPRSLELNVLAVAVSEDIFRIPSMPAG
jgi:hypothetical protein